MLVKLLLLIVGTLVIALGASAQTFRPFPEVPITGISFENFTRLDLDQYPMPIGYPDMRSLLVRMARNPGAILSGPEWQIDQETLLRRSDDGTQITIQLKHETGGVALVRMSLLPNALLQLQQTIIESLVYGGTQTQTTWRGNPERAKVIPIEGASFIANTGEKVGFTAILYSMRNIRVSCGNGDADTLTSRDTRIALAKRPLMLWQQPEDRPLLNPQDDLTLTVTVRTYDAAVITWSAVGARKDDWVRIDTEAGDLSMLGEGQVLVGNIPKTGTTVHCYAISADGTMWYHTALTLSGDPRQAEVRAEADRTWAHGAWPLFGG